MDKQSKLLNIFYRSDLRLNRYPMAVSIRKGLTYMIPLLLLGSFALMILSLPVPAYQTFMVSAFGQDWESLLLLIRDGTFNILSILMVICISYSYISELDQTQYSISPIIGVTISLSSYIAVSGINSTSFSLSNFSASGVFIAVLVSSLSSFLFVKLSSIRFLKVRVYTNGVNASFSYALSSIFPAAITVAVFAAASSTLAKYLGISNIQLFIQRSFSGIFAHMDSQFISGLLFVLIIHMLWFFGVHGNNVLEPVTQSLFAPGTDLNRALLMSGYSPDMIFTKTFIDSFILMGGCGATFCLVTALLIVGKYKNQKGLARLSFLPLMFNINELIVFGLPIVLNPIFLIPFIGVPILLTIISYLATLWGFVPYTIHTVEWTTPILLSGYTATGSIAGSLLQLFNFILGVFCYIPFVKLSERVSKEQLQVNLKLVFETYRQNEQRGYPPSLLSRHDEVGNIARFLAADLGDDIRNNKITLHYQPQNNYDGTIFGIEALLRWKHDNYGDIYPPLVIALAIESGLIDDLGSIIFNQACADLNDLRQSGHQEISMSVNVSAIQLENDDFIPVLEEVLKQYDIPSHLLKIEITEQTALAGSPKIIGRIDAIRNLGIKLAMDDFGMGHSSLKYLQDYDFDTIKLDGSLVREVAANTNCRNIISSIVYLSKSLNCSVVAEYVEREDQKDALFELGCERYQGYLFSKPLPYEDLIQFLDQ